MSFDFDEDLFDSQKPVIIEEEHYDDRCKVKELTLISEVGDSLRVLFEICKCRKGFPDRSMEYEELQRLGVFPKHYERLPGIEIHTRLECQSQVIPIFQTGSFVFKLKKECRCGNASRNFCK
jgi:hypothetical protein